MDSLWRVLQNENLLGYEKHCHHVETGDTCQSQGSWQCIGKTRDHSWSWQKDAGGMFAFTDNAPT